MKQNTWNELTSHQSVNTGVLNHAPTPATYRPWPPVIIRDFLRTGETRVMVADADAPISHVIDFLAQNDRAAAVVIDMHGDLVGVAVDDDVMAVVKRDGVSGLDRELREAAARGRPICSVTDSPHIAIQIMQSQGWDRVAVSERGHVIGIIHRRDLSAFAGN